MRKAKFVRKLIKMEVTWSTRMIKVTSLTGGHEAKFYDFGNVAEVEIDETEDFGKGKEAHDYILTKDTHRDIRDRTRPVGQGHRPK